MQDRAHTDKYSWLPLEQARLIMESIREAPTPGSAVTPCAACTTAERDQYLAATADAALAQRVAAHLAACDACRRTMSEALLQELSPASATPTLGSEQLDAIFSTLQQRTLCPEAECALPPEPLARENEHGC